MGKIFEVMFYKTRLKNGQWADKKYSTSGKCKLGPKWDPYTFIFWTLIENWWDGSGVEGTNANCLWWKQ